MQNISQEVGVRLIIGSTYKRDFTVGFFSMSLTSVTMAHSAVSWAALKRVRIKR